MIPEAEPLLPLCARVLVTDDEPSVRSAVARSLTLSGHYVDEAESGEQALAMIEQNHYDVMILDLEMPGMHGVEVMHRVSQAHPDLLVIILTGKATLESAIAAVKFGAVDFLIKPASVHDISDVVSSALYRKNQALHHKTVDAVSKTLEALLQNQYRQELFPRKPRFLRVGELALDRERNSVSSKKNPGPPVALTESESLLLACLMEQPGQIFSCRELALAALDHNTDELGARTIVPPHISHLRAKIEKNPQDPQFVRTVRGKGYFFSSSDAPPWKKKS